MSAEIELCCKCENETGRCGIDDDSLYTKDGFGPYCEYCYEIYARHNMDKFLDGVA